MERHRIASVLRVQLRCFIQRCLPPTFRSLSSLHVFGARRDGLEAICRPVCRSSNARALVPARGARLRLIMRCAVPRLSFPLLARRRRGGDGPGARTSPWGLRFWQASNRRALFHAHMPPRLCGPALVVPRRRRRVGRGGRVGRAAHAPTDPRTGRAASAVGSRLLFEKFVRCFRCVAGGGLPSHPAAPAPRPREARGGACGAARPSSVGGAAGRRRRRARACGLHPPACARRRRRGASPPRGGGRAAPGAASARLAGRGGGRRRVRWRRRLQRDCPRRRARRVGPGRSCAIDPPAPRPCAQPPAHRFHGDADSDGRAWATKGQRRSRCVR